MMTIGGTPGDPLPPHAFVPGGPWHRPAAEDLRHGDIAPIEGDDWQRSTAYLRGIELFNAGYYWEAHEAWEALWHAQGRSGPTADVIKALIKLAAAGVKVRQRQRHGVVVHAERAAALFAAVRVQKGRTHLGLDLDALIAFAAAIAATPPDDVEPAEAPVVRVFEFTIETATRDSSDKD
jgi:predicted metal-dependent hydrolase